MKKLLVVIVMLAFVLLTGCGKATENKGIEKGKGEAKFPTKEVRLITPFDAGGTMDMAGHALAKGFQEVTGQPLVIMNQPGGAGVPAVTKLLEAQPDGYTLAVLPSGQLSLRPLLQTVNYKFPDDFTPIVQVGDFQMHPVVRGDAPYNTLAEMVEYYKKQGGEIKIGTPGVNTFSHLFAELLSQETGIKYRHVPMEGGTKVVAALLGGHVDMGVINVSEDYANVQAGKLKILGFPVKERYSNFPNVPTVLEQGINIAGSPTFGIWAPANLPPEIAKQLKEIFLKAMDYQDFKQFAKNANVLITKKDPEVMMKEVLEEKEMAEKVLKKK